MHMYEIFETVWLKQKKNNILDQKNTILILFFKNEHFDPFKKTHLDIIEVFPKSNVLKAIEIARNFHSIRILWLNMRNMRRIYYYGKIILKYKKKISIVLMTKLRDII